jgi:hypothetical protein
MTMFNSAPSPKENWASLQKPFKLWEMKPLKNLAKWLMTFRFLQKTKYQSAGYSRTKANKAVRRVVDGKSISRSSKTGRLSYGFANQRFSGGAAHPEHFGKAWNLDHRLEKFKRDDFETWSIPRILKVDSAQRARGSSFQPFAKFSLN